MACANEKSCRAWVSRVLAYAGSVGRNTIDDAAMAAAVSAARSDPSLHPSREIRNDGRTVFRCMTSAEPQNEWSEPASPTCPHSSLGDGCALMK